jgi:hypothetical protein
MTIFWHTLLQMKAVSRKAKWGAAPFGSAVKELSSSTWFCPERW